MESPIIALASHLDELKQTRNNFREMAANNCRCVNLINHKIFQLNGYAYAVVAGLNELNYQL